MLLALHVWFHAHGQDPEQVARASVTVGESDNDIYEMRVQTLLTLGNSMHQAVLRNTLIAHRVAWTEHKQYTKVVADIDANVAHIRRWADMEAACDNVIVPAVHESLFGQRVWQRLGIMGDVEGEWGSVVPPADDESDSHIVWMHWVNTMNMAAEMLAFSSVSSSPPWCFCLLLHESTQSKAMLYLRRLHDLQRLLATSAVPDHMGYIQAMPHLRWTVVVEVLGLLQAGNWNLSSEHGQRVLTLVASNYSGPSGLPNECKCGSKALM